MANGAGTPAATPNPFGPQQQSPSTPMGGGASPLNTGGGMGGQNQMVGTMGGFGGNLGTAGTLGGQQNTAPQFAQNYLQQQQMGQQAAQKYAEMQQPALFGGTAGTPGARFDSNLGQPSQQVAQPIPLPQQQPDMSTAIGQLKGGDQFAAQNTMRQLVGLPPLQAPAYNANPTMSDVQQLLQSGDKASAQEMMQRMVGLPATGAPNQRMSPAPAAPQGIQSLMQARPTLPTNAMQGARVPPQFRRSFGRR